MSEHNGQRPLIAHIVFSFHAGGLENGVVNLINHLPGQQFRHALIALTDCSPAFLARIQRNDLQVHTLHKPPGQTARIYPALYRLLRSLRPDIVHTRNLAALEAQVPAALAGVRARIHGEHGWDVSDPDGLGRKNRFIRRLYSPFVHRYVALSRDIESYLTGRVGIAARRVQRICNGVDVQRFSPADGGGRAALAGSPFNDAGLQVFATVGRLQAIKDQSLLLRAFARVLQQLPAQRARLRLMIVGDGPLRTPLQAEAEALGLAPVVWFAGERADVDAVMRAADVFVLPSRAEGISNTVLEAMASGLPVIASRVGGNPELVVHRACGLLVPAGDEAALAQAMSVYVENEAQRRQDGARARARVEDGFSLQGMVRAYEQLYLDSLRRPGGR